MHLRIAEVRTSRWLLGCLPIATHPWLDVLAAEWLSTEKTPWVMITWGHESSMKETKVLVVKLACHTRWVSDFRHHGLAVGSMLATQQEGSRTDMMSNSELEEPTMVLVSAMKKLKESVRWEAVVTHERTATSIAS
jgi:hypothetical protein